MSSRLSASKVTLPRRADAMSFRLALFTEGPDNKEYVIDGQQRLTSFFSFIDGQFPSTVDFRLKGLAVFAKLNGKKYSELPENLQDQVRSFSLGGDFNSLLK